ncbi:GLPGLI family protein [Larkinella soli]|uniref:GLPGLI family protein n=1 Tax=Larkinella soli TaxID=1770527 RepID=UPI000FFB0E01|nr:GLPGLI family protein [Larkinella soli]
MQTNRFLAGTLLALTLAATTADAQTTSRTVKSGTIQYEVSRRIDPSQMRIVINGAEVKPGSADFPADIPDTRTFSQKLTFAGNYAREEHDEAVGMIRRIDGNGPGQAVRIEPPVREWTYFDLANRKLIQVLQVKKDSVQTESFRAESPFNQVAGWKDIDKTKKIAGLSCRKATVPFKNETYTVWYTTELPFTYSPVNGLMPEKGVVLEIEGSQEAYKAVKIDTSPVAEADLKPGIQAKTITPDELQEQRRKAMAGFRQRTMRRLD